MSHLKAVNVVVDITGQPKIIDFGLAKNWQDDGELTETGLTWMRLVGQRHLKVRRRRKRRMKKDQTQRYDSADAPVADYFSRLSVADYFTN